MTVTHFHRRLLAALRDMGVIPAKAAIIVAVSGGPDSVALLAALVELARRRDTGWTLRAAHLDHGIRGRAGGRDAAFVRKLAAELGCTVQVEQCDVPAAAQRRRQGLEEAARACRYEFLGRIARDCGAGLIALGHQADDQAETILHHVLRGTGLRGLSGMPRCRMLRDGSTIRIVRPLLSFRRDEILDYLRQRGLRFRRDRTNRSARHTRNRIRSRLMPLLQREFNPRAADALLRLGEHASAAMALVDSAAGATLDGAAAASVDSKRPLGVPAARLRGLPSIVQGEIIRRMLAARGGSLREVGAERIAAVLRCIDSGRGGWRVELPGGAAVARRGREIVVTARRRNRPT